MVLKLIFKKTHKNTELAGIVAISIYFFRFYSKMGFKFDKRDHFSFSYRTGSKGDGLNPL